MAQKSYVNELDLRFIKATKKLRLADAEELLAKGANIDAVDIRGRNALIYAARGGNLKVTQFLVENSAKLDIQDPSGWTAAMHSAFHRRPKVAEYLVQSGANLILRNSVGDTARDIAIKKGYQDIAQMFPKVDVLSTIRRGEEALGRLHRGINELKKQKVS